jgi:methionyl-tRNA formyltransferase
MKIIFMGTPDFAVASLQRLVEDNQMVVAVVTAPDKPVGRGQKMSVSPVKKFALANGIPVLQPEKLRSKAFIEELRLFGADLQVVVAFRMLPEVVWQMPKLGTINLHGSLLPQYRGAAPINWAVINGEKETGVTTFFIEKEIDTGQIIFSEKMPIEALDTAGTLHDKMMWLGAGLMLRTVKAIETGQFSKTPQNFDQTLLPAPKIFKDTCQINWQKPAQQIQNFVRGLSPYPAAWTMLGDKQLKVFEVAIQPGVVDESLLKTFVYDYQDTSVSYYSDLRKQLFVKCADSTLLAITELQLEGKKRMHTEEFLRGFRFS